jgi:hypothetical protein
MDYQTGPGPGQSGFRQGDPGKQTSGFLGSLFDISFRSFVTGRIIGLLYIISIVLIALLTVFAIVAAFNASIALGVVVLLVLGPLFFLISVIYVRVLLEIAIVLFWIAENTAEMVRQSRRSS